DGLTKQEINDKIPSLLKMVKLEKWGKIKVKKFSKGMLQRLGLAQAMINNPDLFFLDEPTDGIDPVGRREVRDVLIDLRNSGKTIFLNSHLLSEVERMSDDIAILNNGKLVEQGKLEKFISIEQQYHISIEDNDHKLEKICKELKIHGNEYNGKFTVKVEDSSQLNYLIDTIRSRKLIIESIVPRKISLEDFFIQVVHDEKGETK
ncbi:MAG: ABC transporter ATP-binding protein, partial [Calditrichia bacterium]|nr:ABC transporter ATP-binding protein [Calditrichia bacterium]